MIRGSGNIITEKRATGDFNGISAAGDFDIELINGPVTEVLVEADDNVMEYIETRVSNNILKIRTRNLNSYSNMHMRILITAPLITNVTVSASAGFRAMGPMRYNGKLNFKASSAANIHAGVDAPTVETSASSGATVDISGKTRTYDADCSSGANLKTGELLSEQTSISASSGASARVYASVKLVVHSNSGASVHYRGAANVDKTTNSGGSANKE